MTRKVMVVATGHGYTAAVAGRVHAGLLLREWRTRRRLSQLELSSRTGVDAPSVLRGDWQGPPES